ncbi:MAG: hypothetical protein HY319_30355 [Armatimonadetes bacterium]|nr:hypothetical protein [Armatimonadota bacterium]
MIRRLVLMLLLLASSTVLVCPQETTNAAPLFEIYASTRSVTCLAAEPFLVGTTGGLRAPDGVQLSGLAIRGIAGDWLATDRGLYHRGRRFSNEPASAVAFLPSGLVSGHPRGRVKFWHLVEVVCPTSAPIHSLAWDGERLWAASLEGLWEVTPLGVREITLSKDPLSTTLTALAARDGVVLAGTPCGVYRHRKGEWALLPGAVEISAVGLDSQGQPVVGTAGTGVFVEKDHRLVPLSGSPAEVTAVLSTPEALIVGTPHQGAWLGREGRWIPAYSWKDEVPGNHITALSCAEGALGVGTFEDGLGVLTSSGWEHDLPAAWVNHVACRGDRILVRTSDGSVRSGRPRGSSWQLLGRNAGWPKDWTSALGDGWVGSYSAFYVEEHNRWRVFRPKPELQGVVVTDVARWAHHLWVGSQSGLFQLDPRDGSCRRHLGALSDSWITGVESFDGRLWAGTFSGGLCVGTGQGWTHFRAGTSPLPSDRIHCMLATDRALWVGTPAGLAWTDGERWEHLTAEDGLPSDTVWSLAARGDELWVGTDSGLCRASQRRLTGEGTR